MKWVIASICLKSQLQPRNYQVSKYATYEIEFWNYSCHANTSNFWYIEMYFNNDWQFDMFQRYKDNGHDTC